MGEIFKKDGFTFQEIKSTNPRRPYRVRCLETGDEKDGAISYNEPIGLLLGEYEFAKNLRDRNSKDSEYIEKIFRETLVGRKKSECDRLVEEEIVYGKRIPGVIEAIGNEDRFAEYKEYQTEYFKIKILFENGIARRATKVTIEQR